MSGAEEVITAPEVEAEALSLGWTPKDKFRGAAEKWVDAETFVRRGHEVMPLLKKTNQKLEGDLAESRRQLAELSAQVVAGNQTVKDLVEFQAAEVQRQVKAQLQTLKAQKREARKAGDDALVDDIEEQMDELREEAASAPPPVKITAPTKPAPVEGVSPWATAFAAENDWLGKDKRRTALFMGIADELHSTTGLKERALLDAAKAELEKTLAPPPGPSKTEGHQGGGGGGGSGNGGGKTFSDLPSDAKATCKAEARKFVGPGKAFKDEAGWQAHYAKVFFED